MAIGNIAFWTFFGFAARFWQLGIQKRQPFHPNVLAFYPVYMGVGASFGYWMKGVQERQNALLQRRKDSLLAKRARREARRASGESF